MTYIEKTARAHRLNAFLFAGCALAYLLMLAFTPPASLFYFVGFCTSEALLMSSARRAAALYRAQSTLKQLRDRLSTDQRPAARNLVENIDAVLTMEAA